MKTKFDIGKTTEEINQAMNHVEDVNDFPAYFYQSFFDGTREVYQTEFSQTKQFDEDWIRAIETYYPSLVQITKRLKSSLSHIEEILPIEKTKKIGPSAIRHLSSHSELVIDITEDDEVIPQKLLTAQSEIEYGIYENRFVMTLIKRLESFIGDRLKIIEAEMRGFRDTQLKYNSEFEFNEATYQMSVEVKQMETVNKRKANEHNQIVFERAQVLHKLVSRLNHGEFMRLMKKYKPVSSPIMKTQIILKNADFKNAYLLWLFLDKYYMLEYELDTKKVNKRFTDEYQKLLDQNMMSLFSAFFYSDHKDLDGESDEKPKYRSKKAIYRRRIADEIIVDPQAMEVEPYVANEYFLNMQEKIFDKVVRENVQDSKIYTIGLKNALIQNLKITNDLYTKFFELDQDKDVFSLLIKGDDPVKELDDVIQKHRIARTVREVKQKDFKESIKLEKKWLSEMRRKQKESLNFETKLATQRTKDKIQELNDEYQLLKEARERDFLKKKETMVSNSKQEVTNLSKHLKNQYDNEISKLRENERRILSAKKAKVIAKQEEKLRLMQEKQSAQIERLELRLKNKKKELRDKQKVRIIGERVKSEALIKTQQARIDADMLKKLESEKSKHLKHVENLKERIHEIDEKIVEETEKIKAT